MEGFTALGCTPGDLPTGATVGTPAIAKCARANGHFEWHLTAVERFTPPGKPARHLQPVWFRLF